MSHVPVLWGSCGGHSSGADWLCFGGVSTRMRGIHGLLSRLLHLWVMHGMVMDETRHVLPDGWVGDSFRVC